MQLPNAARARVDGEKITEYLLSVTSRQGRSKAGFFLRYGFTPEAWQVFASALILQGTGHEVVSVAETKYGPRYHVDGTIHSPDGRNPLIRTVWQIDAGTDYPRLITARPLTSPGSRTNGN
jgi:hypothetical protein